MHESQRLPSSSGASAAATGLFLTLKPNRRSLTKCKDLFERLSRDRPSRGARLAESTFHSQVQLRKTRIESALGDVEKITERLERGPPVDPPRN